MNLPYDLWLEAEQLVRSIQDCVDYSHGWDWDESVRVAAAAIVEQRQKGIEILASGKLVAEPVNDHPTH